MTPERRVTLDYLKSPNATETFKGRCDAEPEIDEAMTTRRYLLTGTAMGLLGSFMPRVSAFAEAFDVTHSDAEWRKLLTPEQYTVLRQSGTESPGSSSLLNEHRAGVFACAACSRDLFSSATKFDSHTGWPSFWAPLDGAISETRDTSFFMARTAVRCSRCGGHLGHVFDDGPKPTGLRYCMNGVAMTFKPSAT
jgi:peptide-methionine (R)-S-oxide reductase